MTNTDIAAELRRAALATDNERPLNSLSYPAWLAQYDLRDPREYFLGDMVALRTYLLLVAEAIS